MISIDEFNSTPSERSSLRTAELRLLVLSLLKLMGFSSRRGGDVLFEGRGLEPVSGVGNDSAAFCISSLDVSPGVETFATFATFLEGLSMISKPGDSSRTMFRFDGPLFSSSSETSLDTGFRFLDSVHGVFSDLGGSSGLFSFDLGVSGSGGGGPYFDSHSLASSSSSTKIKNGHWSGSFLSLEHVQT
jgi:hypothetical protein